jgi:hypothetical protein
VKLCVGFDSGLIADVTLVVCEVTNLSIRRKDDSGHRIHDKTEIILNSDCLIIRIQDE